MNDNKMPEQLNLKIQVESIINKIVEHNIDKNNENIEIINYDNDEMFIYNNIDREELKLRLIDQMIDNMNYLGNVYLKGNIYKQISKKTKDKTIQSDLIAKAILDEIGVMKITKDDKNYNKLESTLHFYYNLLEPSYNMFTDKYEFKQDQRYYRVFNDIKRNIKKEINLLKMEEVVDEELEKSGIFEELDELDEEEYSLSNRKFDPFLLFCELFALNKNMYKDIDAIYYKDKYKYSEITKNSAYYNKALLNSNDIETDDYMYKIIGILLASQDEPDLKDEVLCLVQKYWPSIYNYCNSESQIFIDKYFIKLMKKGTIKNMEIDEIAENMLLLFFMAIMMDKSIADDVDSPTYTALISAISHKLMIYTNKDKLITKDKICKEEWNAIKKIKKDIYKKYGNIKSINDILENEKKLNKYYEHIMAIFDIERFGLKKAINNIELDENDITEIIYSCVYNLEYEYKYEDIESFMPMYLTNMTLKYMIKLFRNTKEYYFKKIDDSIYAEQANKEKEYAHNTIEELNKELLNAKNIIKEQERQIDKLEKSIDKYEMDYINYTDELYALRKFIFKMGNNKKDEQDENQNNEQENEDKLAALKNIKGFVIGGTSNWIFRMKKLLPEFTFIHPDNVNFDTKLIGNSDVIFIYTDYISHGIYYKVISTIKSSKKPLCYINQTNEKLLIDQIYEFCTSTQ